jgi:hypothetical protein
MGAMNMIFKIKKVENNFRVERAQKYLIVFLS